MGNVCQSWRGESGVLEGGYRHRSLDHLYEHQRALTRACLNFSGVQGRLCRATHKAGIEEGHGRGGAAGAQLRALPQALHPHARRRAVDTAGPSGARAVPSFDDGRTRHQGKLHPDALARCIRWQTSHTTVDGSFRAESMHGESSGMALVQHRERTRPWTSHSSTASSITTRRAGTTI